MHDHLNNGGRFLSWVLASRAVQRHIWQSAGTHGKAQATRPLLIAAKRTAGQEAQQGGVDAVGQRAVGDAWLQGVGAGVKKGCVACTCQHPHVTTPSPALEMMSSTLPTCSAASTFYSTQSTDQPFSPGMSVSSTVWLSAPGGRLSR